MTGYLRLMLTNCSHNKSDCPEPLNNSGGGGAGRECHNCKKTGHISRDCPDPKVFRCRNCDDEGHHSKECPKPKDWSRVKCRNCEEFGHGAGRCPNPPVETAGGDWGNADGDSGAAIGGWGSTAKPSGDWADESTAAANGDTWAEGAASTSW
jgi:cellular nucleic acid-binding protein